MKKINLIVIILLVLAFVPHSISSDLTYTYNEQKIRKYIPISTNNVTADSLYARIVESSTEIAYEFLFYWDYQSGDHQFAEHDHDWEFVVVYTYPNGTVSQVNYDSWHYYIGRTKDPEAYNNTNVLMFVDESFHYFKPDKMMRKGNISWQRNNQTLHELTDTILQRAKAQVGFDADLFKDPFNWKEKGYFGRYTAFDSWWKAFWVVTDKKFEFIDLTNEDRVFTKWL